MERLAPIRGAGTEEGSTATMTTTFAPAAGGPAWLEAIRHDAVLRLGELPLPSATEERWRYSPIDDLDLTSFTPATTPGTTPDILTPTDAAAVVRIVDGFVVATETEGLPNGVTIRVAEDLGDGLTAAFGSGEEDYLSALHHALAPSLLVIDVAAGVTLEHPIVLATSVSATDGVLTAPWIRVRLGRGAAASLLELVAGGARTVTLSRTEFELADGANLRHVALQETAETAWHLARQVAVVGRDAAITSFSVGLGAAYDRIETDVAVTGRGASSTLRNLYLGTGTQVHDVRTLQDHAADHTTSDLLCKGAVADSARSIYTGTIRIRNGAVRSDAAQTNHNLVLGEHAQADSVPNLDINENDVRCSHGSTVGPVDEDQRYYLESRGIAPEVAERLLISGFFADALEQLPIPSAMGVVAGALAARLAHLTAGLDDA
jgi:Fe-S cluster assembly protein SufD